MIHSEPTVAPIKLGALDPEKIKNIGIHLSIQDGQGETVSNQREYIEAQIKATQPDFPKDDTLSYAANAFKTTLRLLQEDNDLAIVVRLAFPENFPRCESDEIYRKSLAEVELVLEQLVVKGSKFVNIQLECPDESSVSFSESYMSRLRVKFKDVLQ